MPAVVDVIIIGAGIAGLSSAIEAARGGANVVIVEMSSVPGGAAVRVPGGTQRVTALWNEAGRYPNIEFQWNTTAERLISTGGRVTGLRMTYRDRRSARHARNVIVASGGFQSSIDMVARSLPKAKRDERWLAGGGLNAMGSGHEIAQLAGAALVNLERQWFQPHGLADAIDPRRGRWASETAARIVMDREGKAWAVFDMEGLPALPTPESVRAVSTAELGAKTGIDVGALTDLQLGSPPYAAVRTIPVTGIGLGGIRVDHACRVLRREGTVIPGLYAVGEAAGFGGVINVPSPDRLGHRFLDAAAVMGSIAGREIVARLIDASPPAPRPAIQPAVPIAIESDDAVCRKCHVPGNGSRHARRLHADERPCGACHADFFPYDRTRHRMSQAFLSGSCAGCHR